MKIVALTVYTVMLTILVVVPKFLIVAATYLIATEIMQKVAPEKFFGRRLFYKNNNQKRNCYKKDCQVLTAGVISTPKNFDFATLCSGQALGVTDLSLCLN